MTGVGLSTSRPRPPRLAFARESTARKTRRRQRKRGRGKSALRPARRPRPEVRYSKKRLKPAWLRSREKSSIQAFRGDCSSCASVASRSAAALSAEYSVSVPAAASPAFASAGRTSTMWLFCTQPPSTVSIQSSSRASAFAIVPEPAGTSMIRRAPFMSTSSSVATGELIVLAPAHGVIAALTSGAVFVALIFAVIVYANVGG
jgi:hypothetical protein